MPTVINITARGLTKARNIAVELAAVEAALDMPHEERERLSVLVGEDRQKVSVPWQVVQQGLHDQRAKLHVALQEMGINLLPPDPKEAPGLVPISQAL